MVLSSIRFDSALTWDIYPDFKGLSIFFVGLMIYDMLVLTKGEFSLMIFSLAFVLSRSSDIFLSTISSILFNLIFIAFTWFFIYFDISVRFFSYTFSFIFDGLKFFPSFIFLTFLTITYNFSCSWQMSELCRAISASFYSSTLQNTSIEVKLLYWEMKDGDYILRHLGECFIASVNNGSKI